MDGRKTLPRAGPRGLRASIFGVRVTPGCAIGRARTAPRRRRRGALVSGTSAWYVGRRGAPRRRRPCVDLGVVAESPGPRALGQPTFKPRLDWTGNGERPPPTETPGVPRASARAAR